MKYKFRKSVEENPDTLPVAFLDFARKGDIPTLKELLEKHPQFLNLPSGGHNRTLVWEAARWNRLETVQFLLEKGADINIPGRYRNEIPVLLTPYCIAVARKRKQVAEWLKRDPSLINHPDPADDIWHMPPVAYAIAGKQYESIDFFIERKSVFKIYSQILLEFTENLPSPKNLEIARALINAGTEPERRCPSI